VGWLFLKTKTSYSRDYICQKKKKKNKIMLTTETTIQQDLRLNPANSQTGCDGVSMLNIFKILDD
jgi:hypothetical protein